MPSSGYSELANWNGSQSGTRPKSQDSSPNTLSTSTSTASAQSRAKPSGKPLEYTTTEILSSRNAAGSKDTVVGKASSLPRANVSVSVSSLKSLAASTNVTVHEDSLPDAESGLTSKTSSPKEAFQISHPKILSTSSTSPTISKLPASRNIDGYKGRLLYESPGSQINGGINVKVEDIVNESKEPSEITMTDNDAEGSTDDGYIDVEDDKSVVEMLGTNKPTPPNNPCLIRSLPPPQTSSSAREPVSPLFNPRSEYLPPSRPHSTHSPNHDSSQAQPIRLPLPQQRRQFMSYVMVPPLPPGVSQQDYSGLNGILRVRAHGNTNSNGHGNDVIVVRSQSNKGVSGFASVGDALNAALANDRKSGTSGHLKRKYSSQEKGKARARGDGEDGDPPLRNKKPRYHPSHTGPKSSVSSRPIQEPTAFSGDCLLSFQLDMEEHPVPSHAALSSSLRHLVSRLRPRVQSKESGASSDDHHAVPDTGPKRWFWAPVEDDEVENSLEVMLRQSALPVRRPRGRPRKNGMAPIQRDAVLDPGHNPRLTESEVMGLGDHGLSHALPSLPASKGKEKAVDEISRPHPPHQTAKPASVDLDLVLDKYTNGLSDHLTTSPTSKPQSPAKPPNVKTSSDLALSPTGRSPTTTSNSIVHLDIFPQRHNDSNYPYIHGHTSKENHNQAAELSTDNIVRKRDVVIGGSSMLPSEQNQSSILSQSATAAEPASAHTPVTVSDQFIPGTGFDEVGDDTAYTSDGVESWAISGSEPSPISPEECSTPEYTGDGTIDPSLLGGPTQSQPLSPSTEGSRSPSPPLATSLRRTALLTENLNAHSRSVRRPVASSSVTSSTELASSKRAVRQRQFSDYVAADDLDLSSDSETDSDESEAAPRAVSPPLPESMEQEEHSYCHQCRRKTNRKKMSCAALRRDGTPCVRLWCWKCIDDRYPDIPWNHHQSDFTCPACANTCNCTVCCAKRGETYVSTARGRGRGGRPSRGRSEATTRAKVAKPLRKNTKKSSNIALSSYFSGAPTSGMTYWATVYGFNGEKVATAFDDGNNGLVVAQPKLNSSPGGGSSNGSKRIFVGRAQDWWGPGSGDLVNRRLDDRPNGGDTRKGKGKASSAPIRTYVGSVGPLFPPRMHVRPASPLSPSIDSPHSPLPVEGVAEDYDYTHLDGGGEEYGQWVDHDEFGLNDHWQTTDGTLYAASGLEPSDTAKAIQAALNALQDYVGD